MCQGSLWKYGTKGSRVLCYKKNIFIMICLQRNEEKINIDPMRKQNGTHEN